MNDTRRSRAVWMCVAAASLVFSLWLHIRLGDMGFDDAWIHLRIARNLLQTGHAWFNTGERVMATSSPLWTLLMAALHVTAFPRTLPVLEAFLFWAACVIAFGIARRAMADRAVQLRDSIAMSAAVLTGILLVSSSVGQMETPLAVVLLLGAWRAAQENEGMALPLSALAAVTRLELLPAWLLVTALALLGSRRYRVAALEGAAIVLAMAAWTSIQFHVLLPNSMRAKQISYDYTPAHTLQQFLGFRLRDGLIVLLLFATISVAAHHAWKRGAADHSRIALLPVCATLTGLLIVVQYVAHRTVLFEWYRPLYLLPLTLGVLLLMPAALSLRERAGFAIAQAVLLCWLVVPAVRPLPRILKGAATTTVADKSFIDGGDYVRVQEYLQVGQVLAQTCPQARVLASEIGGIGWTFPGVLLDGFGIASPGALRFQPLRNGSPKGGIPAAFVMETMPDAVVSYTVMADQLVNWPAVGRDYDLVLLPTSPRSHRGGLLDIAWRSSTHLDVWVRRGGACNRDTLAHSLHDRID